jgi:hypothetical protein
MSVGSKRLAKSRGRHHRSRISNGSKLLPSVHPQSVWGRVYRDAVDRLVEHVGGEGIATEPERMISKHIAVLDTEALYLADKIGTIRNAGEEPSEKLIDLYSRVTSAARRMLEAIGMERRQRDITSLGQYLDQKAQIDHPTPAGGDMGVHRENTPPKNISQNFSESDDSE